MKSFSFVCFLLPFLSIAAAKSVQRFKNAIEVPCRKGLELICPAFGAVYYESQNQSFLFESDFSKILMKKLDSKEILLRREANEFSAWIDVEFMAQLAVCTLTDCPSDEFKQKLEQTEAYKNFETFISSSGMKELEGLDQLLETTQLILDEGVKSIENDLERIENDIKPLARYPEAVNLKNPSKVFRNKKYSAGKIEELAKESVKLIEFFSKIEKELEDAKIQMATIEAPVDDKKKNVENRKMKSKLNSTITKSTAIMELKPKMEPIMEQARNLKHKVDIFKATAVQIKVKEQSLGLNRDRPNKNILESLLISLDKLRVIVNNEKQKVMGVIMSFLYLKYSSAKYFNEFHTRALDLLNVQTTIFSSMNSFIQNENLDQKMTLPRLRPVYISGIKMMDCNETVLLSMIELVSHDPIFNTDIESFYQNARLTGMDPDSSEFHEGLMEALGNVPDVIYNNIIGIGAYEGCTLKKDTQPFKIETSKATEKMQQVVLNCRNDEKVKAKFPVCKGNLLVDPGKFKALEASGSEEIFAAFIKKIFKAGLVEKNIKTDNPMELLTAFFESAGYVVLATSNTKEKSMKIGKEQTREEFKITFVNGHSSIVYENNEDVFSKKGQEILSLYSQ